MNRVTAKSVLKGLVVTSVAIIGLQGMAFAATGTQTNPAADVKQAFAQDAGKNLASDAKAAPVQVAYRWSRGLNINNACDDNGLPCPPRG
ncbi:MULTISPECIES: hypothetical protein [Pseudomonas syringae group]|uniref:hypothetical protein n=1 Tax=Pseudomonas syringae group TaxID=136849 RepID=UPI000EFF9971|nr:hypothetical protein [Pseudomonas syringae group genomosp. 3]